MSKTNDPKRRKRQEHRRRRQAQRDPRIGCFSDPGPLGVHLVRIGLLP